jgi:hypothetical protein
MSSHPDPILVTTSQAPDAKPVAINRILTTNPQVLIDVPQYRVPELVFGGSTTIEPGVGEIISPLILCNVTAATVTVSVRVFRWADAGGAGLYYFIINQLPIPAYETIPIPLNGQFLGTGDKLEVQCSDDLAVHATLSFTLGQAEEDDVV